ncbi:MAG: DUF2135 domain-containing protein [Candidatus Poseidonia sp.]|nr:DUF2135 domain-containing protein [Poseidonia sp.]MBL6747608.1 DUF2135 domain-containing protein [Poseidonia sp.]MBL6806184.1 DUF2135 domain-containing protein [Poseidonia sp.]MBL6886449.1 DUF2135 domain-containing protein [Poseidonia sp.]MBL6892221.1 DUF2135 domain-containing protein [Poseidonia sp.]
MALEDYIVTIVLGGAFALGLMFIVMRREAQVNIQSGMKAEGLMSQQSGMGFGKAKKNLDRKLANVQDMLRQQNHGDRQLAEDRFNQSRDAKNDDEENRRQQELDAQRRQAEEAQRLEDEEMERRARERDIEEARLAAERESTRQSELAEAEEARLAEIEAAREEEMLESREAAQRAMAELKARLEREGASSSDVQISLMWNNYNDLDLHVVCPSGERIHGGNKTSACGGELDVDANVRAETRKPVENVFWEDGKAPAGKYQVYVHYYKKHKKRRSRDPTKFQVIVNQGGDLLEYNGELSLGDSIMLVAEFTLPSPEERAARRKELAEELRAAGVDVPEVDEKISEIEEQRQADIAAAEQERVAEIEAAREQEMLESREAAQRAMSELKARLEREGASSSDVQVSLMWNNYNDLDLHIVCPSGERIHGGNKTSACGGELDVDANVRAETRKPVENVFWQDGKAPAGKYQVYVHYYKKHNKRRSKDPTKFQVIVNAGNDLLEYTSELSSGDPIMMVAEFTLPSPEEREARRKEIEEEIRLAEEGASSKTKDEDIDLDEAATETTEEDAMLPGAPDLDALMDGQSDDD